MRDRLAELILIAMVCLAPWAYGSVEAWAELGLYIGIAALVVLGPGLSSGAPPRARRLCLPSLALGGLVLLALFQATPLSSTLLSGIDPRAATLRSEVLPAAPERVLGDAGPLVPLPASTLSLAPDSTLATAARLAAAWLLFQCVLGRGGRAEDLTWFARAVVINAALLSLFAIIQALAWDGRIYGIRQAAVASAWSAGGPFLSHNHLAAYLNMGLGLALAMLFQGSPREFLRADSAKWWIAYATAVIAAGIIASHSRSGFLGMLAAGLALALFARRRLVHQGLALLAVAGTTGLLLALLAGPSSFVARLATIFNPTDEGYRVRLEVWRAAIHAWWDRPIWGSGLGSFPLAIIPYLQRERTVFFARAENEYVDMLVEGGIVGWLLAIAFLAGTGLLARRAILGTTDECAQSLVGGAVFGLIALSIASLADFGPHIPAVGITALVLGGQVARLGLSAKATRTAELTQAKPPGAILDRCWAERIGARLARAGAVLLAIVLVGRGIRDKKVEDQLFAVGIPAPGTFMPTAWTGEAASWELRGWNEGLQTTLRRRPDWAEGHFRLGLVHLGLYRLMTQEWLEDADAEGHGHGRYDSAETHRLADPLELLGAIQDRKATDNPVLEKDLLRFDPVRQHLVPAAHCFLEARRCAPGWALPHAELASLAYLLEGGAAAPVYAARAYGRAGHDGPLLMFLAEIAVRAGDLGLAARCRRAASNVNTSG